MMLLIMQTSSAQICSDPAGTIYGMDNSGGIYPINTSNGVVGARINPAYTGNPAASSNAIGYSPSNGRFYFFKRNADQTPQEFVSFNPSTNTYTALASCPTTNNIRTGCVNSLGTGYYCMDAAANLFFYRFSSNNWKLIASTFYNQYGTDVTATIAAHSSGDVAIDGYGSMWLLCSSATQYGLYFFQGPMPTGSAASMNLIEKIAPTTPTPGGSNFAGIGFSPTGQIYISQGNDKFYRLNNNLTLTLLGTFTVTNVGGDMTSCSFPTLVLASHQQDLMVQPVSDEQMLLTWTGNDANVKGFFVEFSRDAQNWTTLGYVESNNTSLSNTKYSFTFQAQTSGRYYYRLRQVGQEGQIVYSEVKFIDIKLNNLVSIGPNPTRSTIQVTNNANAFSRICVLDIAGHFLKQLTLKRGVNSINISELPNGTYLLRLESESGELYHQKIIKE
jgi:hypothetical protein